MTIAHQEREREGLKRNAMVIDSIRNVVKMRRATTIEKVILVKDCAKTCNDIAYYKVSSPFTINITIFLL